VRAGDPIGTVDVLGIRQEVVAPADGIVGASLVEAGEAVEYGQELTWVELLSAPPAADDGSAGEGRGAGGR
jgi:biotin carboxyl carrier protein